MRNFYALVAVDIFIYLYIYFPWIWVTLWQSTRTAFKTRSDLHLNSCSISKERHCLCFLYYSVWVSDETPVKPQITSSSLYECTTKEARNTRVCTLCSAQRGDLASSRLKRTTMAIERTSFVALECLIVLKRRKAWYFFFYIRGILLFNLQTEEKLLKLRRLTDELASETG